MWQNPKPLSSRFCRTIKLIFKRETSELINKENMLIQREISELVPTKVDLDGTEIAISHKMILSLVDGKVCSTISSTLPQICYICGAKPKEMNDIPLKKNGCKQRKF